MSQPEPSDSASTAGAATARSTCPRCGQAVAATDQFCEACGAPLTASRGGGAGRAGTGRARYRRPTGAGARVASTVLRVVARSTPTASARRAASGRRSERDHFSEQPAPDVAAVCDKGIVHARNEDAWPRRPSRMRAGVLVVCDGVTTATDSDVASLAAARAAPRRPRGRTDHRHRAPRRWWSSTGRTSLTRRDRGRGGRRVAARRRGRSGRQPAVVHLRRRRRRRSRPRDRLGGRQPLLLAARRRGRAAAVDRRLVGHQQIAQGTPRDEAEADPRRTRSPGGSASTAPAARRRPHRSRSKGPGGCWSAATASGTTARPPTTSARSSVTGGRRGCRSARGRVVAVSPGRTNRAVTTTSPSRSPADPTDSRRRPHDGPDQEH